MPVSSSKIVLLETQEYFNKISSVATDIKDKESIFKFVEGIFDLGLWDSMICWLLRSSQNAGVGNTVYSLGGLGTYNGTLVDGPTWGANGVTSTGVGTPPPNISLSGTNRSSYSARTFFSIVNPTANTSDNVIALTTNYAQQYLGSGEGLMLGSGNEFVAFTGNDSNYKFIALPSLPLGNYSCLGMSYNSGLVTKFVNSSFQSNPSPTLTTITDTNSIKLMAMNGGGLQDRGLNGTMSAFMDFTVNIEINKWINLCSLYKQTLGQGLGLP